jgi:glycosyltransferase involved in cell wall biosynthesis
MMLPYLPSRGGFRLYGGNLITQLSKRHRIDLITFLQDDDAEHLDWAKQHCNTVTTIPMRKPSFVGRVANAVASFSSGKPLRYREQMRTILEEGLRTRKWDVVHVEGDFPGAILPDDLAIPRVLSLHDSWTLRCAEMLNCAQNFQEKLHFQLLSRFEPRWERLLYPRFDRATVVADRDLEEVQRVVPKGRFDLIPYGTDSDYFHPVEVEKHPTTLVFHSHLGYSPNIGAALEFANEIFPLIQRERPDAIFHLVGANPGPQIQELASRPGIKISANLPDLRPAVCSASLYVCAIRYGTGLKSKMLEAMAMRMPIVCYPGSTVGIEVVHDQHVLVAQDPRSFADHVLALLRDPARASRLAQAGRQLVEQKYSWESRAIAYEQLYRRVIEERGRSNGNGSH